MELGSTAEESLANQGKSVQISFILVISPIPMGSVFF